MENEILIKECLKSALDLFPCTIDFEIGSKVDIVYRSISLVLDALNYEC